jgi:hypothetical protein
MTFMEWCQFCISSGVLSGGIAAATWVLRTERRLYKLEVRAKLA